MQRALAASPDTQQRHRLLSSPLKKSPPSVSPCLLRLAARLHRERQCAPARRQPAAEASPSALSLHCTCTLACLMSSRSRLYPAEPLKVPRHQPLQLRRRSLGRRSDGPGASQSFSQLPLKLVRAGHQSKAEVHLIRILLS